MMYPLLLFVVLQDLGLFLSNTTECVKVVDFTSMQCEAPSFSLFARANIKNLPTEIALIESFGLLLPVMSECTLKIYSYRLAYSILYSLLPSSVGIYARNYNYNQQIFQGIFALFYNCRKDI